VIRGGGCGGLYPALELARHLGRRPGVEITLVNRDNFFLFTPMLHEVAASDIDLTHIVSPLRALLRRTNLFVGDVEAVDLERRTVSVVHGATRHAHQLEYDHLVLALGSTTNFHNLPGLAERALTMKTLGDAIHLRNRVIGQLEEADNECAGDVREPLLTFIVAGGGFAGVETMAGINDFVRQALRFYPRLDERDIRMVLVHSGATILPELGEELGSYAERKLAARGVEMRTGVRVARVQPDLVTLSDGAEIRSRTLVWTAGTAPHPLLMALPCERDHGRLVVNERLEVPGWPGVWALGDCAVVPDRRTGTPYPPTAQHALREGRTLARNILATADGRPTRPFEFTTLGQLAAIGRRTGVAKILGVKFSGFVAWWLWRSIYLSKLPRFERKLRVALDWTLDLFFAKDLVQYLPDRTVAAPEAPAAAAPEPVVPAARQPVPVGASASR
jgi:NADH dehydrogenase